MALNLGDPYVMVDIMPNDETGFNEGISHNLEEFEIFFDHQGGGRLIPQRNRRIEPTKQAGAVRKRTSGISLRA